MDLRDRIADAIARTDHPTTVTVHPLMEDYRDHAEAVMGVVEAEMERQRARFLQIAADQPGIPDYAHEALVRALEGEED